MSELMLDDVTEPWLDNDMTTNTANLPASLLAAIERNEWIIDERYYGAKVFSDEGGTRAADITMHGRRFAYAQCGWHRVTSVRQVIAWLTTGDVA